MSFLTQVGLISILVGFTIAVAVHFVLLKFSTRAHALKPDGLRRSWRQRIAVLLDFVPIPPAIKRKWSGMKNAHKVKQAGLSWNLDQYNAFRWIQVWILGGLGLLIAFERKWDLFGVFVLAAFLVLSLLSPEIWLRRRVESRKLEVELTLPDFLDRLALGLEAGLGFEVGMRRTARNFPGILGEELRYVVRQLDRGHARSDELERMLDRIPSADLAAFVAAVKQTDRLGTSLARTLQLQKTLMRRRRKRRAEEASRRLPVLIVFPLVFLFLPALLIIYLAPPLLHLFLGQ